MAASFVPAARLDALPEGRGLKVEVAGRTVALFRVEGTVRAVADTCPHRGASLGDEGHLDDAGRLICGWHGWTFDPATGARVRTGERCLATYPVRVADGIIWVAIGAT